MGIKKQITDKVRGKANSLGFDFLVKNVCFKRLNKIEFEDLELFRLHNSDQYLRFKIITIKISIWNLFRCRANLLIDIIDIEINVKEIHSTSISFGNLSILTNYRKGLSLSEIKIEKSLLFVQIEHHKDNVEFYLKVEDQNWNDLIDPFRDTFNSDLLRKSYLDSKMSFFAYLKYFHNKTIPFFSTNIETPNFIINKEIQNNHFIDTITHQDLKILLISKVLDGNFNSYLDLINFPETLIEVFIATEDPGFEKHKGVDPRFVGLAIKENMDKKKISRGASTITMQVVRNLFLTHDRIFMRKVEECILSLLLENYFNITKNNIIELYLNLIEFAPGIHGVNNAAQFYFDKKPNELTITEILVLTYIIPRPLHFHEALLQQTEQLKKNLKRHISAYAYSLWQNEVINKDLYNTLSYNIEFRSLNITLNLNNH